MVRNHGEKVKIAIADDHSAIRKAVRTALEKISNVMIVGEAEDGQQAIALVEDFAPDILILDINMPVLDGIEVLDILSERKVQIIVIVFTAMEDRIYEEQILFHGACHFISKTDIGQLVEIVRETVSGVSECQ